MGYIFGVLSLGERKGDGGYKRGMEVNLVLFILVFLFR